MNEAAGATPVSGTMKMPRIALTSGEPAGIGPELCLAVAREPLECELVCLADRALLAERARVLKTTLPQSSVTLLEYDPAGRVAHVPGQLSVSHHALAAPCVPGKLDRANAPYVLRLVDRAVDGALSGEFAAIVTAPVHKGIINDAGIPFIGHTEYLAERTGAALPVMMLATSDLRIALATTHMPLRDVSAAISVDSLCRVMEVVDRDLRRWWHIASPRIAVCGLNPHAGEGGHLGDEEIRTISPAIARMRERGLDVTGPVPADTAFVPAKLAACDAVLAMYHDQGLPVIKHAGFERAVNVTLGLPILRTSVDHGTALIRLALALTAAAHPARA
jgi:4-hydroxythreonine-4-phosphate dehydrogenase